MFDDLVVSSVHGKKTHKSWTVILSAVIQAAIVGVLILIPLLVTEALPKGMLTTFLMTPPPPAPPPPPPAPKVIVKPVQHLIQQGKLMTPTVVPKDIKIIKEEAAPDVSGMTGGVVGGIAGGSSGGVLGGIMGGTSNMPPPPKPQKPLKVGGNVQEANLIHKVMPQYPIIAKTAHVQGTVVFHAIIGKDGTIQQLTYMSGPQMLVPSARSAISQWRYRPTMLNGEAVEVDTTISIDFTME
ncbi:MAG TPA: energy transducer TonB [Candidatus Acidoferrales bacterium]|nr:energy transducer TonB [Candidatus Acidoferrales bacterium]